MKLTKIYSSGMFAMLLLFSASSCMNEVVEETVMEPSAEHLALEQADKQLAENLAMYETTWDDIINKGEIDKINATNFDEGVILVSGTENIVGIEGFKGYYQNYLTGFSDITLTIVDVFGQGDKIVKHWNFKGSHTGNFFGIPASGKAVDIDGVTLVLMKDGKIAQERDFLDNLDFLKQLGLIPED